jgi:hypothetical protein
MNTVLVIWVIMAGVMQPTQNEIVAMTGDCITEIRTVQEINRANQAAGRDIQYVFQCENR